MNSTMRFVFVILLSFFSLGIGRGYAFGAIDSQNRVEQIRAPIPVDALFSPEENLGTYTEPFLLSPDGKMLAYRAPGASSQTQDTSNIWVKVLATGECRQVTYIGSGNRTGNVGRYFWQSDSKKIWYLKDSGGDDKYQLYAVPVLFDSRNHLQGHFTVAQPTQYTYPPGHIRVISFLQPVIYNPSRSQELVFVHNGTASRLNMLTGKLEKLSGIPGAPIVDNYGEIRASEATTATGKQLFVKEEDGSWVPHITWGPEEFEAASILGFDATGSLIYLIDSVGSDTARLITYNPSTRERTVIASDDEHDLSMRVPYSIVYRPDGAIGAVSVYKDMRSWIFCDDVTEQFFNQFRGLDSGEMRVISQDRYGRKAVIAFDEPSRGSRYYLVDAVTGSSELISELLQKAEPAVNGYQMGVAEPIRFESRDGHMVHGYLTFPVGHTVNDNGPLSPDTPDRDISSPAAGDNRHVTRMPARVANGVDRFHNPRVPLVVLVHGGPRQRDLWAYRPDVQFFASRGYAVLHVNFRGSDGYGKKWRTLGFRQWGGSMVNDIIDGTRWVIKKGIADPENIVIMGGSYGGFAALTAAMKEPGFYAAVIDLYGITNLLDFFGRVRKDAPEFYKLLIHTVGDVDRDRARLKAQSPYFNARQLRCPVFVAHGAKDSRVPLEESEKFVSQLKKYGILHEYHLFDDEGHGFRTWQNNRKLFGLIEAFLAKHSLFKM